MNGLDGSSLRRVGGEAPGAVYALVSPKGDRVAFVSNSASVVYTTPLPAVAKVSPTELKGTDAGGKRLNPTGWSPDGARLAGTLIADSGRPSGIGTYDFTAQTVTEYNSDEGSAVKRLADSRRVVYFGKSGTELVVLDTATRKRIIVDVRFPVPQSSTSCSRTVPTTGRSTTGLPERKPTFGWWSEPTASRIPDRFFAFDGRFPAVAGQQAYGGVVMRQLLTIGISVATRAIWALLVASPAAAQVTSDVPLKNRLRLPDLLSEVCPARSTEEQPQASRAASSGTRCHKAVGLFEVATVNKGGAANFQSAGPAGGRGAKVAAIVAGVAAAAGGIYLWKTSRGWAEPDFGSPGRLRPCTYEKGSDLAQRCYTNRIAIGVPLFITGGALVAWGFGVE